MTDDTATVIVITVDNAPGLSFSEEAREEGAYGAEAGDTAMEVFDKLAVGVITDHEASESDVMPGTTVNNKLVTPRRLDFRAALIEALIAGLSRPDSDWALALTGNTDEVALGLGWDMVLAAYKVRIAQSLSLGSAVLMDANNEWGFTVVGDTGASMGGWKDADFYTPYAGGSANLAMLYRDNQNIAYSQAVMTRPHNVPVAALDTDWPLYLAYGQSLANGQEAWPALSTTSRPDCFMIGLSVRPATYIGATWTPMGGSSALHPLKATVDPLTNTARAPLSDAAVAALSPGNGAEGEPVIVAITNQIAKGWKDRGGSAPRTHIAMCAAVGGRNIEELSKGASPEYYNRNVDAMNLHHSLAVAAGKTSSLVLVPYMGNEANYTTAEGGSTDEAAFEAHFLTLRDAFIADAQATYGQTQPPAFLLYQTSGQFVDDAAHMSIAMAQWKLALNTPGIWMAGPSYPVTDKGGHLDSNGSRWLGAQMAKVGRRIVVDRMDWEPLGPRWIDSTTSKAMIDIGWHVPAGPLQFRPSYQLSAAVDYADKGFRVEDVDGFLTLRGVEIIGSSIIRLHCDRTPDPATTWIWCGDKTVHNGHACFCDSDATRADDLYTYLAASGMYAEANIEALVGQPYPLNNWPVNFRLPLGWSR